MHNVFNLVAEENVIYFFFNKVFYSLLTFLDSCHFYSASVSAFSELLSTNMRSLACGNIVLHARSWPGLVNSARSECTHELKELLCGLVLLPGCCISSAALNSDIQMYIFFRVQCSCMSPTAWTRVEMPSPCHMAAERYLNYF